MFDNSELTNRISAVDGMTLTETTKTIARCVACCSTAASMADTMIRKSTSEWRSKDIDEVVRLCTAASNKLFEIMWDGMEQNMYDTDFTQL